MTRVFNFSAGPAVVPVEVLEQLREELLDWHGTGMSVMEMSHRGKAFIGIAEQAEADLRELLAVPSNYKVLFLQGGATAQFAAVPLNLTRAGSRPSTTSTPVRGRRRRSPRRSATARVNVAADAAASGYNRSPAVRDMEALARRRLPALHAERDDRRRRVPRRSGRRRRAAGRRHVFDDPVAADRRQRVRRHLRRRAEEHRAGRSRRGHRARRPARPRARGDADASSTSGDGERRLDAQHAGDVLVVRRRVSCSSGSSARADSRRWSELNRAKADKLYAAIDGSAFYTNPVAEGRALVDERAVHAARTPELDKPFLDGARKARAS